EITDSKPLNVLIDNNGNLRYVDLDFSLSKDETNSENKSENSDTQSLDANIASQSPNVNPTDKQKETGIYAKARVNLQGYNITIETPKGRTRSGKAQDGNEWSVTMRNHYGELDGTVGYDGDAIDVFIGDNPNAGQVFVIDQIHPQTGAFDESKVMLGFDSAAQAKEAYLSNFEAGWKGFGSITPAGDNFKQWLYDGAKQRKPFSEYKDTPEAVGDATPRFRISELSIEFDNAKDLNERFTVGTELINELEKQLGTSGTVIFKTNKEFADYFPHISRADRQSLLSGKITGAYLNGVQYIGIEAVKSSKAIFVTLWHENTHYGNSKTLTKKDLLNLYDQLGEEKIKEIIPSEDWDMAKDRQADEAIAYESEKLLENNTIKDILDNNYDDSNLNPVLKPYILQTIKTLQDENSKRTVGLRPESDISNRNIGQSGQRNRQESGGDKSQRRETDRTATQKDNNRRAGGNTRLTPEALNKINDRFNSELQQQIDGTLPKGHVYRLGTPKGILQSVEMPEIQIELSASHLSVKANDKGHPFDIKLIKDLPLEIQKPIAVFTYGDKGKAQNLIVEIEHEGNKFLIGIHFNQNKRGLEINDIRGLFPKDTSGWLNWINQGKLLYVDKEKVQNLISQHQTNSGEVGYLDLNSVANIIQKFENPTIPERFNTKQETPAQGASVVLSESNQSKADAVHQLQDKAQNAGEIVLVNDRFNEDLDRFSQGEMKPNEVLTLGKPQDTLQSAGVKAGEIRITQSVLKGKLKQHGIKAEELKGLAKAVQQPLMVYEWGDKSKSTIIITDITRDNGDKITVAIGLERNGNVLEVNDISSVRGKSDERFINDMLDAKKGGLTEALRYVDKEKALNWLAVAPPKGASQTNERLNSIANLILKFETPTVTERFISIQDGNVLT
ncbi:MAG: hypothetical protein ACK5MK_08605, partial [Dysgonomonas sp.]